MGFDCDQSKVTRLAAGKSYIKHIAAEWIARCVGDGTFGPTANMARLAKPDALLICVPTPLNESRDPDLIFIEQTAAANRQGVAPGQLVVLESTTYPGTTREVVLPILAAGGLTVGKDFFLAFTQPGLQQPRCLAGQPGLRLLVGDAASRRPIASCRRPGWPTAARRGRGTWPRPAVRCRAVR